MNRLVSSNHALTFVAVAVSVSLLSLLIGRRRIPRGLRLPPGPVHIPIVGNVFGIDPKKPWTTYAEWGSRYGEIFMIRVFKQDIIVINSERIAKELLECKSSIYSDRPYLAARDPFGWSFNFGWAQYGDHWRSQRKFFHQAFRPEAAHTFRPIHLKKVRQLVLDILNTPRDYSVHIQKFAAAVIMAIVYDYEVAPAHDPLVELFERGNVLALQGLTLELSSIVDAFPFLLSLPEWFPGAVIKRMAAVSKECAIRMIAEPFEYARKREAEGSNAPAVAIDLLREMKHASDPAQLQLLKDTCATAFVGKRHHGMIQAELLIKCKSKAGAETSASTLQCFMLAMVQNPHAQGRAQAEIDTVVGASRFPNFDDRPNLPYVEAVLLETLRLYAVAPLAIPHATTADDVYKDIFIPKGSTIVPNIWAMHRNQDVYPEPYAFKPERFFEDGILKGIKSVDNCAFGFGRRVCPGRYAADGTVWAAMVSILYAFKIAKARDDQGKEIEFTPTFNTGVTTCPNPFPCSISPRQMNANIHKLLATDF